MKQIFTAISIIVLFFLMLCFPKQTLLGASNGLLLWFDVILPTLLPFLILTSLMVQTNSISYIGTIFGSFLGKFFSVSSYGSFAVISGFLCGYPVGAKVTVDLLNSKRISLSEAKYLLSFCNNTSPAFIASYLVLQSFKEEALLLPTMFIIYLSPVLCSFLFRKFYHPCPTLSGKETTEPVHFDFQIFDHCIMSAFETITKIGGYIIVFSILFQLGKSLPTNLFLPALEITNGIPYILKNYLLFHEYYPLALALTSFGGICSIAQTNAILGDSELSIFPYIIQKLITTTVTSLLVIAYVIIIHHR